MTAIVKLSEHLKSIGVDVDPQDLWQVVLYEHQQQQRYNETIKHLNITIVAPRANKTLLIIGAVALGFGVALLFGASLITAIAIGGAIGLRFLNSGKNSKKKESKQARINNAPGFDTVPQPPEIGSLIPFIYCNSSVTGVGIRTTGNVIFSRVVTVSNKQKLQLLRVIGFGNITNIQSSKLLLDNQPISNFYTDEIQTNYSSGTYDQSRFETIPYYCQSVAVSNQNTVGLSKRGEITGATGNIATTTDAFFDDFSPNEIYQYQGTEFKITNKNRNSFKLFTSKNLSYTASDKVIYSKFRAKFKTLDSCSSLELNMVMNIWSRDADNNLKTFAVAFYVYIDGVNLGIFYSYNKSESDIRRSFRIDNLQYSNHLIEIFPTIDLTNAVGFYNLDDSGFFRSINTGITINGKQISIYIESKPENSISVGTLSGYLNTTNAQKSSDRGAVVRVSTVNQITYPIDLGQTTMINYPSLKLAYNEILSSDRLTSSPAISDYVEVSEPLRNHISAGKAGVGSFGNSLNIIGQDTAYINTQIIKGLYARNITRSIDSPVTRLSGNNITTLDSLNWRSGDKFLLYFLDGLCYFPDVYCDTLINKYSLGYAVDEKFIDYPSICRSRRFCEQQRYFYQDVIDTPENWAEWALRQSVASMLFPVDFTGNYGLLPEQYEEPTSIYSVSNIKPGSFKEAPPDSKYINTVAISYMYVDENNFFRKTLFCMTAAAYTGAEQQIIERLDYETIVSSAQARSVAGKYLKSRLLQNNTIQFKTGMDGMSNNGGDLILVQYGMVDGEPEYSGFVLDVITTTGTTPTITSTVKLSVAIASLTPASTASVYHTISGTVEKGKPIIISGSNIIISGLSEAIAPRSATHNGDIVIVNTDWTKKLYRITDINIEQYECSINCVYWTPAILNTSDLFYIE
jgi:hypothetical protein